MSLADAIERLKRERPNASEYEIADRAAAELLTDAAQLRAQLSEAFWNRRQYDVTKGLAERAQELERQALTTLRERYG